jgi:hypothetical protein
MLTGPLVDMVFLDFLSSILVLLFFPTSGTTAARMHSGPSTGRVFLAFSKPSISLTSLHSSALPSKCVRTSGFGVSFL